MSIIDIAKGNRRRGFSRESVGGYQGASTVRNATVQADSDGGTATVLIDGSDEPVTLACEAPVSQGQRCTVAFQSGSYVIVTLGEVPAQAAAASEAADQAQQAASDAQSAASSAQSAAAAASAAADDAAEKAQQAIDDIDGVTATVNGVVQDVDQLSSEVSGAVETANGAASAASAAQQDIEGFKQTVSQTYATKSALEATDAKADAATTAAQGAQDAADAAQGDIDGFKGTVSTTYATKTELSQTASSITQSVSDTYITKTDAAADYQPKGDYATSGDLDEAIAQEVLNRDSAITQSASEIAQTVSETYQVKGDYATGSELDSAIAQEVLDRNSAIEQSATSITQTVSQTYLSKQDASSTYATKSQLTQTADSINATVSDLSGAVTSVTQTADSLTIKLGEAEEDIAAAKSTATQAKNDAASAQSTATQAKTAAGEAKSTAATAKSTADTAKSTADQAKTDAATANGNATQAKSDASSAQSTANSAKSAATAAQTAASNAAKTATNYLFEENGLTIGRKSGSSWTGTRLNLSPSEMRFLSSSGSELASYGSSSVSLLSGEFSIDAYSNYVSMRAFGAGVLILGDEDYYSGINAYQNISFVSSIGCVTVSNGSTIQDNYSRASNRQAVGAKILFENASGSTGNVTLNETAANMSVIEIAYGDGTRHYTKRVYAPNGKYVTVDRQIFNANYYLAANNYLVSGTRMTYQAATTGQALLSNGTNQTVNSTRQLKVYQVIGWR